MQVKKKASELVRKNYITLDELNQAARELQQARAQFMKGAFVVTGGTALFVGFSYLQLVGVAALSLVITARGIQTDQHIKENNLRNNWRVAKRALAIHNAKISGGPPRGYRDNTSPWGPREGDGPQP